MQCGALKFLVVSAGLQISRLGYWPLEDFLLLYLLGQGLITSPSTWVLHSRFFQISNASVLLKAVLCIFF